MSGWTRDEMMTVAAARQLRDGSVCFVGIGLPSAACNLARLTHAPDVVLIYESGTLGTRPDVLPLSIGDGELADTAACVVPLPEIFSYFLQAKPGCYFLIGNGDGAHRSLGHGEGPCMLHNPSYDFNDDLIPLGATLWVRLAEAWLAGKRAA